MARRNILLNGAIVSTSDPPDFILARKQEGVWQVICRGGIFTFDRKHPSPFNVERLTRAQVKALLALFKQFGDSGLRRFKPRLFVDFQARIPSKYIFAVDCIEDAKAADAREMSWRKTNKLVTP